MFFLEVLTKITRFVLQKQRADDIGPWAFWRLSAEPL